MAALTKVIDDLNNTHRLDLEITYRVTADDSDSKDGFATDYVIRLYRKVGPESESKVRMRNG